MESDLSRFPTPVLASEADETRDTTAADRKATHHRSSSSTSSPKKSSIRRSVHKRVVSIPIGHPEASRGGKGGGGGAGEGAPPADSWAWRKYGQKPIKGSPYPRGYYRCSSSKGCPARKQVERSRLEPSILVVTYTSDHNHAWPLPRGHQNPNSSPIPKPKASPPPPEAREEIPTAPVDPCTPDPGGDFADLIGHDSSMMMLTMPEDLNWLPGLGPTASGSPAGDTAWMLTDECDGLGGGGEEDSLFADLGELPECSVVFRRGFLECKG